MDITNEGQVDGAAAKALRDRAGLSQKVFWSAFGVSQPGGWRYERGAAIPLAIRRLIFAEHVAGLKLDAATDTSAAAVVRAGQLVRADEHAKEAQRLLAELNHPPHHKEK